METNVIAQNLKRIRQLKGWTQDQVAKSLGITKGAVSNHENNQRVLNVFDIEKYANLYGVLPGTLFDVNFNEDKGRIVMNEKENIKKNIANLLKSKNWSTYDLATKIGVSQPAVQGWLSRGSINKANLAKVAKLFNTTTDNLIGGSSSALNPIPTRRIAVLSWVQAGTWTNMPDNVEYDEYIETDSSIGNDCYALRVNGDSMMGSNRTIPEGSIVIVQPCELDFDRLNHKVVIAIEDGDATMKELVLDGSVPYLKPWNPAYSIIKFTEATKIIGRVIRVQYEP